MDLPLAPTIVFLVAAWYVLLPWKVWKELKPQAAWDMETFDPGQHGSVVRASAFLATSVSPLIARGFRQVGDLVYLGPMNTTRVAVLTHPDEDFVVTVVVIATYEESKVAMVEFTAELERGTVFDVNNSPQVGSFARTPDHVTYRFPDVRDPERLHRIAQALLRRDFGSARLRRHDLSDPAAFLKAATDREFQRQVGTGYFRVDARTGRYFTTLKGAYLMAWKLMFPFKSIRKALYAQQARRLLQDLGMDR
jgi:hypothetical protein